MMHVLGGAYFERCEAPYWNEFFGSGVRAAVAARAFTPVTLHTSIGDEAQTLLHLIESVYGIKSRVIRARCSVRFRYFHGLSEPDVDYVPLNPRPSIEVKGRAILRFGMIEAESIVHGDRVVYDPQSGSASRPFEENGSTALELAIVANDGELQALSGARNIEAAAKLLLSRGATVVVAKRGPSGAHVFTDRATYRVPAYRTPKVFKIGTGDVFSAVFAAQWAVKRIPARRAAEIASRAVASYCAAPVFPLNPRTLKRPSFPVAPSPAKGKPPLVYLAGPFFNLAQRWMVGEARAALIEMGLRVFSPLHDVGFGKPDKVVTADLRALNQSTLVFALLDGLDSGTLFEVGYARSRGIPVIGYLDHEKDDALVMPQGSNCQLFTDFVTAIYQAAWTAHSA